MRRKEIAAPMVTHSPGLAPILPPLFSHEGSSQSSVELSVTGLRPRYINAHLLRISFLPFYSSHITHHTSPSNITHIIFALVSLLHSTSNISLSFWELALFLSLITSILIPSSRSVAVVGLSSTSTCCTELLSSPLWQVVHLLCQTSSASAKESLKKFHQMHRLQLASSPVYLAHLVSLP